MTILIPIERLTTGNEIYIHDANKGCEVYAVEFDGEGYYVDYCYDDAHGWDALERVYFKAGSSVEYTGEESLLVYRDKSAMTDMEWEALNDA